MVRFRLKACTKCGGDLALDEGDWICLQCGTYYYVRLYGTTSPGLQLPPARRPDAEKAVRVDVVPDPTMPEWGHLEGYPGTTGVAARMRHTMVAASLAAVVSASDVIKW